MKKENQSKIISRLNSKWEATITISLPLPVLDRIAKMATRAKCEPVDVIKHFIVDCVAEGK